MISIVKYLSEGVPLPMPPGRYYNVGGNAVHHANVRIRQMSDGRQIGHDTQSGNKLTPDEMIQKPLTREKYTAKYGSFHS